MTRNKKPPRRLPKFALTSPSQRSLAQEDVVVRQAQANRREAKGQWDLSWLPIQTKGDSRHLMQFPQPPKAA
jgi:hypothetical protein